MKPLITFLLFAAHFLVAQNAEFYGTVVNGFKQPVPYANVLLKSVSDNTIVYGVSSNENGAFIIKNVLPNDYLLEVSFIGYKTFFKNVTIKTSQNIGFIVLKEDVEALDKVEIIAKKPILKKEADRLVFKVENTALSEGNIMEVLKSTPGVLVLDGAITIKNSSPTIYINNRKVQLSQEEIIQLLEGTQADAIQSVEVITNPPAKYDADGKAVLNIIMKKNLATGYRGNLYGNYTQGVFPRYNGGYSNFFKTGKINLYANYSYTHNKVDRVNDEHVNFIQNDKVADVWKTHLDRNSWANRHNGNFNLDYFIDDRNTLSVAANLLLLPYFKYKTTGNTTISAPNNTLKTKLDSYNLSFDNKYDTGIDLDFVHKFKNGASTTFNTHFTNYDYERNQNVKSVYTKANNVLDFVNRFKTESQQNTDILTSQIDVSLPWQKAAVSAGLKTSYVETESLINQFNIINDGPVLDTNNTDAYDYKESIFAAYFSLDKSWEKWNLSAGLRVENTSVKGLSLYTKQINKQDYFEFFPTVNLSYLASDKVTIYSNYSRSIERPSYQSLNPFKFFLNDNTIVTGNPKLNPAFNDYIVLGLTLLDTYTFETYYSNTKFSFFELPIQDNSDQKIYYTPTNLSNTVEYGLDFITYLGITKRWNVYFVTSLYNTEDSAVINGKPLKMNMWSNYTAINNAISFLKNNSLKANVTVTYLHDNLEGFREVKSRLISNVTLTKSVFKKKANLVLTISDLFNQQDFRVSSNYLDQDNATTILLDNRLIKLGFNYKFGNSNLSTNQRDISKKERERLEKKQ